jgi:hypothetical protein
MAGGSDRWYPTDKYGGRITVDSPHAVNHSGRHWEASHTVSVGTATAASILITNGSYDSHFVFAVMATNAVTYAFSEAPNASGGTPVVSYNNNRPHGIGSSPITVTHTPTYVSSGTVLQNFAVGTAGLGNSTGGGAGEARNEWILDPGVLYLVRVTALNAATTVVINTATYELDS